MDLRLTRLENGLKFFLRDARVAVTLFFYYHYEEALSCSDAGLWEVSMGDANNRTIVVTGATGLQGGAVTRHLLRDGWHVRALTRNPRSEKARAIAAIGADVVQ